MDNVIELIKLTVNELIQYHLEEYAEYANRLVNVMFEVFPGIIALYSDERLSDIANEATYWPAQLEKIVRVLEQDDEFAVVDALYNETLPNLLELKALLIERGIV